MKNWIVMTACLVFTSPAWAQADKTDKTATGAVTSAPAKKRTGKEPDMQAMMAAYEKAASPGDQHKLLQKLNGKWTATVKTWQGPGEPTSEPGTADTKSILGERFVQTAFTSAMMGKPFSGIGTTGYDNAKKKFVGTWVDVDRHHEPRRQG